MTNSNKKKLFASALTTAFVLSTFQTSVSQGFGIKANNFGQPVHETLTMKAAIDSGAITDPKSAQMVHLIEGVRFNDDPEGYLLDGAMPEEQQGAIAFAMEFVFGSKKPSKIKNDPTKASHFGEFQFLHSMGSGQESAANIKTKMMLFAAHCYRMATDPNSLNNFINDYVAITGQAKNPNPDFKYTREQIITRQAIELFPKEVLFFHADNQVEFQYRALGSLLHMIQDSYSKGHTVRVGFEKGANDGNILYFQDYSAQDHDEHKHTDELKKGKVNSETVFQISGTSVAYERTKQILQMVVNKCPWTSADLEERSACKQSMFGLLNNDILNFENESASESMKTRSHPELQPKPKANDPYEMYGG